MLLKKLLIILLALAALAAGLLLLTRTPVVLVPHEHTSDGRPSHSSTAGVVQARLPCACEGTSTTEEGPQRSSPRRARALTSTPELAAADDPAPDPAEQCVETFDALTDVWEAPAKKGVTMKDVDGFVAAFRRIPADRRDECVHRALNLIPDENVMLLAGILMDKSMDNETRETVFADILNRDEAVKTPILREVQKDKSHPCWEDANWLLD